MDQIRRRLEKAWLLVLLGQLTLGFASVQSRASSVDECERTLAITEFATRALPAQAWTAPRNRVEYTSATDQQVHQVLVIPRAILAGAAENQVIDYDLALFIQPRKTPPLKGWTSLEHFSRRMWKDNSQAILASLHRYLNRLAPDDPGQFLTRDLFGPLQDWKNRIYVLPVRGALFAQAGFQVHLSSNQLFHPLQWEAEVEDFLTPAFAGFWTEERKEAFERLFYDWNQLFEQRAGIDRPINARFFDRVNRLPLSWFGNKKMVSPSWIRGFQTSLKHYLTSLDSDEFLTGTRLALRAALFLQSRFPASRSSWDSLGLSTLVFDPQWADRRFRRQGRGGVLFPDGLEGLWSPDSPVNRPLATKAFLAWMEWLDPLLDLVIQMTAYNGEHPEETRTLLDTTELSEFIRVVYTWLTPVSFGIRTPDGASLEELRNRYALFFVDVFRTHLLSMSPYISSAVLLDFASRNQFISSSLNPLQGTWPQTRLEQQERAQTLSKRREQLEVERRTLESRLTRVLRR